MAAHHQLSLPPTEVPGRVQSRTSTGPESGPTGVPDGTDGLSLLVEGVKECRCSEKEIYLALGLPDHSYWGKVKNREKPEPRINRLTELPEDAQRAVVKRWARQLRMTVSEQDARDQAALDLAQAAMTYLRMAR